jgi:hypothetical protein
VIVLVDDIVGISAEGFYDGKSWSSLIYSGIFLASKENHGKPRHNRVGACSSLLLC